MRRSTLPSRSPTQVTFKAPQFKPSASNAKAFSRAAPSHSPLFASASQTPTDTYNVLVDKEEVIMLSNILIAPLPYNMSLLTLRTRLRSSKGVMWML